MTATLYIKFYPIRYSVVILASQPSRKNTIAITYFNIILCKVDPLVSLMMVEKVPDSTYEMVGGLDKQIKEIKEVCISLLEKSTFKLIRCKF